MKRIFTLLLWGLAVTASAQSVYKCRDAKGNPVYQSDPCPEAEKRWDTQPRDYTADDHRKRVEADRRIEQDRRHMRARANGARPAGAGPVGAELPAHAGRNPGACAAAKAQRDATLKTVGLNRDFQLLRQLDDAVFNACK